MMRPHGIVGTIWVRDVSDPMYGKPVLEGEQVVYAVERTDVNEIAIHATLPGDGESVVSFYLADSTAAIIVADLIRALLVEIRGAGG